MSACQNTNFSAVVLFAVHVYRMSLKVGVTGISNGFWKVYTGIFWGDSVLCELDKSKNSSDNSDGGKPLQPLEKGRWIGSAG
jgi:hypothetical protein